MSGFTIENGPEVIDTPDLHFAAVRTQTDAQSMGEKLPVLWPQVFAWIAGRGQAPAGAPFIAYHEMNTVFDISVGIPTATCMEADGDVETGTLPAGRHLSTTVAGHYDQLGEAHQQIRAWAAEQNLELGSSVEFYDNDPSEAPDPDDWLTRILYRVNT